MSVPLLQLEGVHTHIGAYHILHGVDLEITRGELTVLLGRNGAGKTTTLRTIMGLWPASSGAIRFDGGEIGALSTPEIAHRGISYVPENMGIFGDLTVREALREAVVNALVHADHRGQGGVVIERYPDRIELSNPGSLLVSRVQLLQGGVSECRNKSLQLMFQLMGGGDKAGSGMDKIRAGWRAQHWRSPRLEESLQPDRVKLVLPMVSLIPDEVDRRFACALASASPSWTRRRCRRW